MHVIHPQGWNFHPLHSNRSPLSYVPILRKVLTLTFSRLKVYIHTEASITLQWAVFELLSSFGDKFTERSPQMALTCPRSYWILCILNPRPEYVPHFRVMAQFWEKCTKWPQNDLDMFECQKDLCAYNHMPQGSNSQPFHSTLSHLRVTDQFLRKVMPNDPKVTLTYSSSKVHASEQPHMPTKAHIFSLYDEPFSSYGPVLINVHWMTPKWHWLLQGQRGPCAHYIYPQGPIFVWFPLLWAVSSYSQFWRSVHQINQKVTPWHNISRSQLYIYAYYIHPQDPNFHLSDFTMNCFWVMAQLWEKFTQN